MNTSAPLALALLLSAVPGFAQAGTMASPSIYWSPGQERATCTIRNVGKSAVSVEVAILTESGDPLSVFPDTCNGASLAPGKACSVTHFGIANGVAFACSALRIARDSSVSLRRARYPDASTTTSFRSSPYVR